MELDKQPCIETENFEVKQSCGELLDSDEARRGYAAYAITLIDREPRLCGCVASGAVMCEYATRTSFAALLANSEDATAWLSVELTDALLPVSFSFCRFETPARAALFTADVSV